MAAERDRAGVEMSDLIERLRGYIPNGDGYNSEFAHDMAEAADEIERLQREASKHYVACAFMHEESGELRHAIVGDEDGWIDLYKKCDCGKSPEQEEIERNINTIVRLAEEIAALKRENEELREEHRTLTRQVGEWRDLCEEARSNDKTAMGYLNDVRSIVGGDDFPDMVKRVAALKAQSTEPVAWLRLDGDEDDEGYKLSNPKDPRAFAVYRTPPTATALVEDFKRRAVEVCNSVSDRAMVVGELDYWVVQVRNAIESLPLIGEK